MKVVFFPPKHTGSRFSHLKQMSRIHTVSLWLTRQIMCVAPPRSEGLFFLFNVGEACLARCGLAERRKVVLPDECSRSGFITKLFQATESLDSQISCAPNEAIGRAEVAFCHQRISFSEAAA